MIKVLILGGGFGGVRAALDLSRFLSRKNFGTKKSRILDFVSRSGGTKSGEKQFEITLVDKNSYHFFTPALYEVASAYGIKQDPFALRLRKTICIPYADIFPACAGRSDKKIKFVQAEVASIDVENKKIATKGGEILDYDYLVLALGGQAADFGIPGVKEYAFQFKTLEDGLMLNRKLDELVKEMASGAKTAPLKISVIGAGFTGIEVAAELACCVKKLAKACLLSVALAKGGNIKSKCERIILVESAPQILPLVFGQERDVIVKRLTQLGIEIVSNAAVEEVKNSELKLKNGRTIPSDLIVWTTGIKPAGILASLPNYSLTESKKIKVDSSLAVVGLSNVFAVGDNIEFLNSRTGKPVPALAYVAADQGRVAADNIARSLKAKKLRSYNPFFGVWIAPVGGKYALAHLWFGINLKGIWGWLVRELVDLKYLFSILSVDKAISLFWQEVTLFTKND